MSSCVSGCCLRGEHLAECDGTTVDRGGGVVECRGCLPRPAEVGVLCQWCWGRLQSVVRTMPALVDHLWEVAVPSVSSPSGYTGSGGSAPGPRALYPASLSVADDLVGMLAAWCDYVAEVRGLVVPRPAGLWLTDRDGGQDAVVAGVRSSSAARALVRWLDPHLSWCAAQSWAGDLVGDLVPAVSGAQAAWPVEEPERRVTTVRCPSCGRRSLVLRPPRVVGGQVQVCCSEVSCGVVMGEEDWARARARAVAVARLAAAQPSRPAPGGEGV